MVFLYKNKIPKRDDIVIAKVDNISPYGVNVTLIEYNNFQGFINCSEISRKKKVNMNKLLTIGKNIHLIVIAVDEEKGLADLSKRSINEEEINIYNEKNKNHIKLYNIFKSIFMKYNDIKKPDEINKDYLYDFLCDTIWDIEENFDYDSINKNLLSKNNNLEIINSLKNNSIDIDKLKLLLDDYIDNKLFHAKPTLNSNIKLLSYNINGLEDIKYVLDLTTLSQYQNIIQDFIINITYMTNSNYSINIEQKEYENIFNFTIKDIFEIIKNEIINRSTQKQIDSIIN